MKKKQTEHILKTEKSLPENNLSESIIASLPGLFYLYDDTGKFIHWNKNFETVSGYSGSEISQMHPLDFFHSSQKDLLQTKIQEVFEKGEANIEADFYTKDKALIPFYFNGYSIVYRNKRCLIGVGIDISERIAAEKKKAESEGQFRELFDNSMDGILLTRPNGQILHANTAACKMFGMTEKELCAAGRDGVTDPSDMRLPNLLDQRKRFGKARGEITFVRKNGENFPAEITTSVYTDTDGLEKTSLIIHDIVHLKNTENSLRKLNRELYLLNNANKLIFKASDEALLLQNICNLLVSEGKYKTSWIGLMPESQNPSQVVNAAAHAGAAKNLTTEIKLDLGDAKQRQGPTAKAMLGGKPAVVNQIADDPGYLPWKTFAAAYGFASSASFPIIINEKVIASLNIYSENASSFDAEEVHILASITDNLGYAIAGIRNAKNKELTEKKLNYNEQNLQLIFSSTYDIIFMLSLEAGKRFKFISVNDAFLSATGLKAEQVFNKYLDEVIPPDSLPVVLEKYQTAIRSKSPMQWEETSHYPSGIKTGIVTITPVGDENGDFNRLVGFVHDITERKQAEEDMNRMNNQLRNLSNHMQTIAETERTAIAREIHDVLGQQMTALKYDIAWLKKRKGNETEIQNRVESMNKLLDESILSIRKVSSELRPKILDDLGLNAAIEWYVSEFEKNTGIQCRIDSDLEDLRFEKPVSITMYRILQEALTNVARHSKATQVIISAKLDGKTIVLQIQDNGKGITDGEKSNALSLGLLGMKERAKMIGGELSIRGTKDQGTIVVLKTPVGKN